MFLPEMLSSTTGDSHGKQNRFQKPTFSTDSSDSGQPEWRVWSTLNQVLAGAAETRFLGKPRDPLKDGDNPPRPVKSGELADSRLEPTNAVPKGAQFSGHNLLRNRG
jgi:hypothetical protein